MNATDILSLRDYTPWIKLQEKKLKLSAEKPVQIMPINIYSHHQTAGIKKIQTTHHGQNLRATIALECFLRWNFNLGRSNAENRKGLAWLANPLIIILILQKIYHASSPVRDKISVEINATYVKKSRRDAILFWNFKIYRSL